MSAARTGKVQVSWRVRGRLVSDAEVRRIVRRALRHGRRPGLDVAVVILGDAALARLHQQWLGDPAPTDVISLDLSDAHSKLGELYVSASCARRVAAERGVAPARELALYLVHGVLHLCGHDDRRASERRRMRAAERRVLRALGYPDDPGPHP